jgi:hypothetical protein
MRAIKGGAKRAADSHEVTASRPPPLAEIALSTRRRHSPPQICRMEGVICFETARGV